MYRVAAFTSFKPEYEQLVREREYPPERGSVIGRTALERVEDRVATEPVPELQLKGLTRPVVAVRAIAIRD